MAHSSLRVEFDTVFDQTCFNRLATDLNISMFGHLYETMGHMSICGIMSNRLMTFTWNGQKRYRSIILYHIFSICFKHRSDIGSFHEEGTLPYLNGDKLTAAEPMGKIAPPHIPSRSLQEYRCINVFITSILKSLVILAIWVALRSAIYSQIALFFALNCIFFSANESEAVKQNNQSDFKVFF